MTKIEKISNRQFFFLIFCLLLSNSLFGLPNAVFSDMGQDFWMALLVSLAVDTLMGLILYILGLRHPEQTLFEYSETIFGKLIGKFMALTFTLFFIFLCAIIIRILTDFFIAAIMPEMPLLVLSLLLIGVSIYVVNGGIESIARLSEMIGPLLIISILAIVILNVNLIEYKNLFPQFQHDLFEIYQGSLLPISWFGLCITLGIFMAYHNEPKSALKMKVLAVSAGVFLLTITFAEAITVLGASVCSDQLYPLHRLAQMTRAGDFFERLESLEVIIWMAGGFISIAIFLFSATLGAAGILKVKNYQSLTPFIGLFIALLSVFMFGNVAERWDFLSHSTFPYLLLSVEFVLPTFILMVSLIRFRKKKPPQNQEKAEV